RLRWRLEGWESATSLRGDGVGMRAVTLWALLGSFDWDALLTLERGRYEPGAFDVRAPEPRPTALAGLARELSGGRPPTSPVLAERGWWHRPERLVYGSAVAAPAGAGGARGGTPASFRAARPLLVTGGRGTLGSAFARACHGRGIAARVLTRTDADITDRDAM